MIVLGNSVKLPDVTSTGRQSANMFSGIKPAAELKTGSVMSILGENVKTQFRFNIPFLHSHFGNNLHSQVNLA